MKFYMAYHRKTGEYSYIFMGVAIKLRGSNNSDPYEAQVKRVCFSKMGSTLIAGVSYMCVI